MRSLDAKLASIHGDPGGARDFILADAKDADMAFGLAAPGVDPVTGAARSLADFRDQIREIVRQGLVDIMLMSVSTSERLTRDERLFEGSATTPAVRANDTSDIHMLAGAAYPQQPSRPFRTPTTEQIKGAAGVDLALYSITPANDAALDVASLEAYRDFRAARTRRRRAGPRAVSQRLRRAHARRHPERRSATVLEDALPGPARDGGARRV